MVKRPRIVVQLSDLGERELGQALMSYAKRNTTGKYFLAERVDPAGPYFFMLIDTGIDGEDGANLELSVPHAFIRYYVSAESEQAIGFLRKHAPG